MKLEIAIDPGKHGCGLAMFIDGLLVHAEYVSGLGGQRHPLLEPVAGVVKILESARDAGEIETVVIERPKIYDATHQKGDQRDIADLLIVAGGLACAASLVSRSVLFVEPSQWKGQTSTEIIEHRLQKHLSTEEHEKIEWPRARKTLGHNVVDAVGIGLWHVGRMGS